MTEAIGSVYSTPRLCLPCGKDFLPPRRKDKRILDYCSEACDRKAGLSPVRRDPAPVQRSSVTAIRRVQKPRRKIEQRTACARRTTLDGPGGFGQRLAQLRIARGLHVAELAELIRVHPNSILNWETDRSEPGLSKLIVLAGVLGISLEHLATGKDPCPCSRKRAALRGARRSV